ncbi:MAG: SspB family protein [Paracoccaceae bacterium]
MSSDIDYGNLMHRAMRGLIQEVLQDVAKDGLPGQHHFFITFDTMQPDVEIPDWLSDRYPEEMTIVVQHWFDNLDVTNEGFAITLNFGDNPEPLYIPYDAIKTFVDPSVEFGLRFENQDGEEEKNVASTVQNIADDQKNTVPKTVSQPDADVVSLDSFRK